MITVYQLLHGGMAVDPETFLKRNCSEQTRGHPWKLRKPRASSLTRRNTFSTRVVNDWNSLPASVVSASSINQFKARLDKHWASLMYDISNKSLPVPWLKSSMRAGSSGQVVFLPPDHG